MLDKVRYSLEAALTSTSTFDGLKKAVSDLLNDIYLYMDENKRKADLHATFRVIEEYDSLFRVETNKFMAMPQDLHKDRIYQVQEILTICSLVLSYLNTQLKRYNTEVTETRGTTAKALRQLQEAKEHYRGEKMSWGGILKSETTIVNALIEQTKYQTIATLPEAVTEAEVDI